MSLMWKAIPSPRSVAILMSDLCYLSKCWPWHFNPRSEKSTNLFWMTWPRLKLQTQKHATPCFWYRKYISQIMLWQNRMHSLIRSKITWWIVKCIHENAHEQVKITNIDQVYKSYFKKYKIKKKMGKHGSLEINLNISKGTLIFKKRQWYKVKDSYEVVVSFITSGA